jgi:hypothetical protein
MFLKKNLDLELKNNLFFNFNFFKAKYTTEKNKKEKFCSKCALDKAI